MPRCSVGYTTHLLQYNNAYIKLSAEISHAEKKFLDG